MLLEKCFSQCKAIHFGHLDVYENGLDCALDLRGVEEVEGLLAVLGYPGNGNVVVFGEQFSQCLTNKGVVVRDTYTDHDLFSMTCVGGCERGMEADVSQVPLSISVFSEPPIVESLSFMPRIPIPEEGRL